MLLAAGTGTTWDSPPSGGQLCDPSNPSTCYVPLQSCPSGTFQYIQIFQTVVTDPHGNDFMLGSAATSGLVNPEIGRYSNSPGGPFAPAINISSTDHLTLPFGTGVGGFTMASNLLNPPNTVSPEGPYYWWTVAGSEYGNNLRLDQNPSIVPTSINGTYEWDLEGQVYCTGLSTPLFFDAMLQFIVTPGIGGPTRTIGYWQTHLAAEQTTWAAYIAAHPGGASICGLTVTTAAQAMGGFWASIPKLTNHNPRDNVSQAEMILVQQWIGALLNVQAFGTDDGGLLAAGQAACNTDNITAITNAAAALDTFNNSGDSLPISLVGNATPQAAKNFADKAFWDSV